MGRPLADELRDALVEVWQRIGPDVLGAQGIPRDTGSTLDAETVRDLVADRAEAHLDELAQHWRALPTDVRRRLLAEAFPPGSVYGW